MRLGLRPSWRRLGAVGLACCVALTACTGSADSAPPASTGAPSAATSSTGPTSSMTPTPSPSASSASASPSPKRIELPRGGTTVFPKYRLVGYSGYPGAPALGRLGVGDLDDRVKEMERRAKPYAKGRTVLPTLELITTVVHSSPGKDGMYRTRIDESIIKSHLAAARRHQAILLLNIQPGRADFLDEVKGYEKWLSEPDVGLALDPEWAVGPGEVPGRVFGSTTGKELDSVASWVSALVAKHHLPEKVVVYHQLHVNIVENEKRLTTHTGVVMIKSVDGIGSPGAKVDTWKVVIARKPKFVHPGFKLFYTEDRAGGNALMTPAQVMALKPTPEYILYE